MLNFSKHDLVEVEDQYDMRLTANERSIDVQICNQ